MKTRSDEPSQGASRRERGNAMLEFALAFVMVFPLFTGGFRFGYSYYVYNNLESAVRGAARYASLRTYNSSTSTPSTAYLTAVQNMAVYGNPAGGTRPVAPGLTASNIGLTVTMDKGVPRQVRVAVHEYTINSLFGSINLREKPSMSVVYIGNFAP
ncbi:MAG: pilus assembly protein [Acidobacteriales bacterium]|nr:pilus assembly protein [Terriglobales bacterium]